MPKAWVTASTISAMHASHCGLCNENYFGSICHTRLTSISTIVSSPRPYGACTACSMSCWAWRGPMGSPPSPTPCTSKPGKTGANMPEVQNYDASSRESSRSRSCSAASGIASLLFQVLLFPLGRNHLFNRAYLVWPRLFEMFQIQMFDELRQG